MLAIRLQRTGRSGHAQFRVIVQDDRFSPKGGRVTAYVGSYDPHTKAAILDKEKIAQFLKNGAQPSDRVAKLLQKEGVELPSWVKLDGQKQRPIRNLEKLRRNRPAGAPAPVEAPAEEPASAEQPAEGPEPEQPVAEVKAEDQEKAPEPEAAAAEPAAEGDKTPTEAETPAQEQPAEPVQETKAGDSEAA